MQRRADGGFDDDSDEEYQPDNSQDGEDIDGEYFDDDFDGPDDEEDMG